MRIRRYLALALLVLSVSAAANFSTVVQAYEVDLDDLRLPGHVSGTLGFKDCSDCASQTIQVNGYTRYVLNGRTVTLERFKSRLEEIRGNGSHSATVLHHLESNVITGVKVTLR